MGRVLPTDMLKPATLVSMIGTEGQIGAYNWTPKAIGVLGGVMRVVECTAVRGGFESMRKSPTGWHRAHRNTWDAVRPFRVLLIDAMPMHGGTFSRPGDGIVHRDLNSVPPIGFNQGLEIQR